jgi:YcxB-like protein
MFVRLRVNWIACGIAVSVLFTFSIYLLVAEDKVNFRCIVMVAVMAVVGGLAATLFGILCYIATIAATAKRAGLLVPFDLMLGEDGVRIQSANGEGLLRWSAVALVKRNGNYIFVGITPYTFLVIPLRVLRSRQESEAFWARMCDLSRASARGP